ncbi:MAG: nucleotide exchange factor GrpE, partial [Acidimicrobiales bacterium]
PDGGPPDGGPPDGGPPDGGPRGAEPGTAPTGTTPTGDEEAPPEGPASDGPPADEGAEILADVAALSAERDEYLGALQRLKADFDNYRKRVLRQQEEQAARAAADLVGKLLPVLDTLDLAQAHLGSTPSGNGSDEAQALHAARAQLLDTLAKEGLERLDAAEVVFDPTVHDAVAHAPTGSGPADGESSPDGGEPAPAAPGGVVVDEVMRAGYRWRGQVLRPAMVRVRG